MTESSNKGNNVFRVIAGEWRSRRLTFPGDVESLRPTSDRIRETLFNWLQQKVVDARCLDLFAGSGALSFEAVSRGAQHVTAVDLSARAITQINDNCKKVATDAITTVTADSLAWLKQQSGTRYDIIFLDPPFSKELLAQCCTLIAQNALLAPDGIVYLESGNRLDDFQLPSSWHLVRNKKAGKVYFGVCSQSIN